MEKIRVLNFSDFAKIFEEETKTDTTSESSPLKADDPGYYAAWITSNFIPQFNKIVTSIEGYKDYTKDLNDLMKSQDKAQTMNQLLDKAVGLVKDPEIKKSASNLSSVLKKFSALFKEEMESIEKEEDKKKVQEYLDDYITSVRDEVIKGVNSLKESKSTNPNFLPLLEKNTFKGERDDLAKEIVLMVSDLDYDIKNPASDEIQSGLKPLQDQLKKIMKDLSDDSSWENMKRRERINSLKKLQEETLPELKQKISEVRTSVVKKLGRKNQRAKEFNSLIDELLGAASKFDEIKGQQEQKQIEAKAEEPKKEEEKKPEAEGKKESDYSEIKSGKEEVENLKKKGKNLSKIKDLQTKLNEFLPKEKQITADGLYGKNTEDAIKTVASILSLVDSGLKGTDGKRMSPKFQYVLDKVSGEGKNKIAELVKKAS